jgi:protein TonB
MAIALEATWRLERDDERLNKRVLVPLLLSIALHALAVAGALWLPQAAPVLETEVIAVELVPPQAEIPPPVEAQPAPAEEPAVTPEPTPPPVTQALEPPIPEPPVVAAIVPPQPEIALPEIAPPEPQALQSQIAPPPPRPVQRPAPPPPPPRRAVQAPARPEPAPDTTRTAPPQAPQQAAAPAARAADAIAAEYRARLQALIEARKQYPMQLQLRRVEGTVELRVTIAADGSVRDISVATEINARLAASAVEAVRAAAPFPAFPQGLAGPTRVFPILLTYKLG